MKKAASTVHEELGASTTLFLRYILRARDQLQCRHKCKLFAPRYVPWLACFLLRIRNLLVNLSISKSHVAVSYGDANSPRTYQICVVGSKQ